MTQRKNIFQIKSQKKIVTHLFQYRNSSNNRNYPSGKSIYPSEKSIYHSAKVLSPFTVPVTVLANLPKSKKHILGNDT